MNDTYINHITKEVSTRKALCKASNASIARGSDYGDWKHVKKTPPPEAPEGQYVTIDGISEENGQYTHRWVFVQTPDEPVLVPQTISIFQALAQLDIDGAYDEVAAYFAAESTPRIEKLAWEKVQVVERQSNMANNLGSMLGWDAARMDQFFTEANLIKI